MRCRYCGYEIPDGILYCEKCGGEVRIVPDYNPLDDMLAAHVKEALNNTGRNGRQNEGRRRANTGRTAAMGSDGRTAAMRSRDGRTAAMRADGRTAAMRGAGGRTAAMRSRDGRTAAMRTADGRTAAMRGTGGRTAAMRSGTRRGNTAMMQEETARRKQAERRKALKKKRRNVLLTLFLIFAAAAGGVAALYFTSYAGIVYLGNRALGAGEYMKATDYFQKAISRDKTKADAYEGLSKVYIAQNDLSEAESLFLGALDKQPENAELYRAAFEFYLDTKQPMGIPSLLSSADSKILEELPEYVVSEPEFSLDDKTVFDDVQQLTITSPDGVIRYTVDGSLPDTDSTEFKEPLQLSEGTNMIKAIAVNKNGVPSQTVEKQFVIELPIEDAPAVSPSTGQYDFAQSIEVKVPDEYEAFYTMDGTDPTTASDKYTGPIEMPKGETLFKAILVTKSGRVSGITTRNYVRE